MGQHLLFVSPSQNIMLSYVVAAAGLLLGPSCPAVVPATRAAAPNMALLDFLNKPREILQSAVTIDNTKSGGAPETLAGKMTSSSWSPECAPVLHHCLPESLC